MGGGWTGEPQGLSRGEKAGSELPASPACGVASGSGLIPPLKEVIGSLSAGKGTDGKKAGITGSG